MDFFAHQDLARRTSRRLVFLFALAVVCIVVAIYLAVVLLVFGAQVRAGAGHGGLLNPRLFFLVAAATLLVIAAGTLFKSWQLSSGGSAVASLLGGRPIDPNTTRTDERRLLNVVEEMAIASGTPVPEVYVLENERAINAFAAGLTREDAVIAVTEGTLALLSRDELQGVVAHEFSHLLNGDMRLNVRLMGLVYGILVISMIGYFLMRTGAFGRSSSRRGKGGGAAGIVFFGMALYAIGWIGVFFGRLIKAAVSRQHEYLADASAVQFTRNPQGLSGALEKIGGYSAGSLIQSHRAEEASHLFFADGLKKGLFAMTATHPPLEERIRRIDPSWDGSYPPVAWPRAAAGEVAGPEPARAAAGGAVARMGTLAGAAVLGASVASGAGSGVAGGKEGSAAPAAVAARVGTVDTEHLTYAARLKERIPDVLLEAAREPAGARALVFALLLDRRDEVRGRQLAELSAAAEPPVLAETETLAAELAHCPSEARLPLAGLALPALRRISEAQYRGFRQATKALAEADGRIDLFEYALHRMLLRHLDARFGGPKPPRVEYYSLRALGWECSVVLSILAYAGQPAPDDARRAFDAAVAELADTRAELTFLQRSACGLKEVGRALDRLARVAAPHLRGLLRAAVVAVGLDGEVTEEEAELLRAVADGLGLPVPPFLTA
jgi:Zn-dependent protease with chaperone function/tellurite resistance protein